MTATNTILGYIIDKLASVFQFASSPEPFLYQDATSSPASNGAESEVSTSLETENPYLQSDRNTLLARIHHEGDKVLCSYYMSFYTLGGTMETTSTAPAVGWVETPQQNRASERDRQTSRS